MKCIYSSHALLCTQDDHGTKQVRSVRSSRQQYSPPPQNAPYLYKWICKFHVALLAKVGQKHHYFKPIPVHFSLLTQ